MKDDRQRLAFDLGFAPDADPLSRGVVTDCRNFVPTPRGMQALAAPVFVAGSILDGPVFTTQRIIAYGFRAQSETFAQNAEYAATKDALYLRTDRYLDWVDITSASKLYDSGFWTFTNFGTVVIGAEGSEVLQAPSPNVPYALHTLPLISTGPTKATPIAGAPTCCIVTSAERFVLAFNGRDGDGDTWNCSARDDHTSWTLSPATLAAQGRLVEPYGPITAALPMGNDVIVYKPAGAIRGRFVPGDAEVWKWQKLPVRIGAASPRAACQLPDGRHAVMNAESCWIFDGSQAVDVLAGRAREWFQLNVANTTYQYGGMATVYDGISNSVWFTFKQPSEVLATYALVYHLGTGKLGLVALPADLIVETGDVYGGLSTVRTPGYFESNTHRMLAIGYGTVGDTAISAANAGANPANPVPLYIDSGDTGDPFDLIDITGLQLDFVRRGDPSSSLDVRLYSRDARDAASIADGTAEFKTAQHIDTGDRYAVRSSSHWHRVRVVVEGGAPVDLSGVWLRAAKTKSERGG